MSGDRGFAVAPFAVAPFAVAITGAGVVSPLGNDVATFTRRMLGGASGVVDIRGSVVPAGFPVPFGGVVDRAALPAVDGGRGDAVADCNRFAAAATAQALAGLPAGAGVDGVVYGTAEGLNFEVVQASFRDGPARERPEAYAESSLLVIADQLARRGHGALAPTRAVAVSSACASGNQAIGLAFQRIRSGRWRRALAGGVDARLLPANLMSFHMLSALVVEDGPPARASRPFARDRAGFVRSEGAATLLLERLDDALARGATILGRVLGYAHTNDAFHVTEGREDGEAVVAAMAGAVRDAGLRPDAVDAISAHGTSTPLNDRLETQAIKAFLGERAFEVPVTALKSQIGHATVAAGAIEAVSCLAMLAEQTLAPTLNQNPDDPDPICDLDYVPNVARPADRLEVVLSNSLGFGGHNACVVFGR